MINDGRAFNNFSTSTMYDAFISIFFRALVIACQLFEKALDLFDGDEKLLNKYWELIRPTDGAKRASSNGHG
ncbi:hypothetical protein GCM10008968_00310 [Bacillus horti]